MSYFPCRLTGKYLNWNTHVYSLRNGRRLQSAINAYLCLHFLTASRTFQEHVTLVPRLRRRFHNCIHFFCSIFFNHFLFTADISIIYLGYIIVLTLAASVSTHMLFFIWHNARVLRFQQFKCYRISNSIFSRVVSMLQKLALFSVMPHYVQHYMWAYIYLISYFYLFLHICSSDTTCDENDLLLQTAIIAALFRTYCSCVSSEMDRRRLLVHYWTVDGWSKLPNRFLQLQPRR
jgi:hypothetical protein